MKVRTAFVLVALIVGSLVAAAPEARAEFHEMKITEVHAGNASDAGVELVELRMYTSGQQFVDNHTLRFYAASAAITNCVVPADVSNGASQSYVNFASTSAQTLYGAADFTIPSPLIDPAGGAICWGPSADCVTWGSFSGSVNDDDGAVTNPEPAIPNDQSIHREDGGDDLLQESEDTNNSNNDFSAGTQTSTPNGANVGTLTCTAGGGGGDGGGGGGQGGDPNVAVNNLKTKTPGNKAVISGQIAPPDPGDVVIVKVFAKSSPFKKVGKKRDSLDADSRFKVKIGGVPDDAVKCKATVKYAGNIEATKKFTC